MSATTRERIVVAARDLTGHEGWASVTMARLAAEVGVSRQTVYNEIGTKKALAETLIAEELAAFLTVVEAAFGQHPDDLVAAIRTATQRVLEHAQDNRLLHAVVSATHGADTELLPLLTTNSAALLETAKAVVIEHVAAYDVRLSSMELTGAIDMVVRVVLSHVMQPSGTPGETARQLAWMAQRVLT